MTKSKLIEAKVNELMENGIFIYSEPLKDVVTRLVTKSCEDVPLHEIDSIKIMTDNDNVYSNDIEICLMEKRDSGVPSIIDMEVI
jgi:hypothetical protein